MFHICTLLFSIDVIECKSSTCSGNGDCVELTGPGTLCTCYEGYTLDDCSEGMLIFTCYIP